MVVLFTFSSILQSCYVELRISRNISNLRDDESRLYIFMLSFHVTKHLSGALGGCVPLLLHSYVYLVFYNFAASSS